MRHWDEALPLDAGKEISRLGHCSSASHLALESEAPDLFLELAELMPSAQQRSALLEAAQQAGWRAASTKPLSTQVQAVSRQSPTSFIPLTPQAQCAMASRRDPGELRVLKGSGLADRQRQR